MKLRNTLIALAISATLPGVALVATSEDNGANGDKPMKDRFDRLDQDGNGRIDGEEFKAGGKFLFGGLAALGGEARPLAREVRREYGPRLREAGKAMHDARREVGGMLRADEIDPAELDKALAELRKRSDEAQAVMHELLTEAITKLTLDQRRKFLEAAMQRGPRGDRRPPPDGPPPGN